MGKGGGATSRTKTSQNAPEQREKEIKKNIAYTTILFKSGIQKCKIMILMAYVTIIAAHDAPMSNISSSTTTFDCEVNIEAK